MKRSTDREKARIRQQKRQGNRPREIPVSKIRRGGERELQPNLSSNQPIFFKI
jgi:hypothetical protein